MTFRYLMVVFVSIIYFESWAQDEGYSNERVSNALGQGVELHSLSYLTDGNNRHRLGYEYGEFYYNDFAVGPKVGVMTTENDDQGIALGLFAKNYFLKRYVRLFIQVELNGVFLFTDDLGNRSSTQADTYIEYGLQPGLSYPIDFGADLIMFDLFYHYMAPAGEPEIRTQGNGIGIRIAYVY